jgi:hypothetical protein
MQAEDEWSVKTNQPMPSAMTTGQNAMLNARAHRGRFDGAIGGTDKDGVGVVVGCHVSTVSMP